MPSMPTDRVVAGIGTTFVRIEDSANNKHHDVTLQISRMKYSDILRDTNG